MKSFVLRIDTTIHFLGGDTTEITWEEYETLEEVMARARILRPKVAEVEIYRLL